MTDTFILKDMAPDWNGADDLRARYVSDRVAEGMESVRSDYVRVAERALKAGKMLWNSALDLQPFFVPFPSDGSNKNPSGALLPSPKSLPSIVGIAKIPWSKGLSPQGEGLIRRAHFRVIQDGVPPILETLRNEICHELESLRSGPQAENWRDQSEATPKWPVPECGPLTVDKIRAGSYLAGVLSAVTAAKGLKTDVLVWGLGDQAAFPLIDFEALEEAARLGDRAFLFDRIENWVAGSKEHMAAEAKHEMHNLSELELLIKATHPAQKVELAEDEEPFGHYLALEGGFDLPSERRAGEVLHFEITPGSLERLAAALVSVAAGTLNGNALANLAEEFGYSEEMAEGVVSWFSGKENDQYVRKRRRLEKIVRQAQEGKATLLLIHKEDA